MQLIIDSEDREALAAANTLREYCITRKCNACIFIGKSGCMFRGGNVVCELDLERINNIVYKGGRP